MNEEMENVENLLDAYVAAWVQWYESPMDETAECRKKSDAARAALLAAVSPKATSPAV